MCRLLGIYGQVDFWQEIVLGFRRQAEFGNIPPVEGMELVTRMDGVWPDPARIRPQWFR